MERLQPLRGETSDRGEAPVAVRRREVTDEYRATTREGKNIHKISDYEATPDLSKQSPQGLSPSESTGSASPTSLASPTRKFAYVCRDWERGSCLRPNCKFAHGPVPVARASPKTWSQIARNSSQMQKEVGTQTTWNIDASTQVGASYVEQTQGNNLCRFSSMTTDTDCSPAQDASCTNSSLATSQGHAPTASRTEQPTDRPHSWFGSLTNAIARITRRECHRPEMDTRRPPANLKDDTSLPRDLSNQFNENASSVHGKLDEDKQHIKQATPQASVVNTSRTLIQVKDGLDASHKVEALGEHRPTQKKRHNRTLDRAPGHKHAPALGGDPNRTSPEHITRSPRASIAPHQTELDASTSADATDGAAHSTTPHIGPESFIEDDVGLDFAIWRHGLTVDTAVVERLLLLDPLELTSIAENKLLLEAKIAEVRDILVAQGVAENTDVEHSDVAPSSIEVDAEQIEVYKTLCKELERTKPKKRSIRQTLLQLVLDNAPAKARQAIANRKAVEGQSREHGTRILSRFAANTATVHFHCLGKPLPEEWRM